MARLFGRRSDAGRPAPDSPATYAPVPPDEGETVLAGAGEADREIVRRASAHTLTGTLRLLALIDAVRYCVARDLQGAFVECGVWQGGSVIAMILTLAELGRDDRDIYLFDTFEGMTQPTAADTSAYQAPALEIHEAARRERRVAFQELFDPEDFNLEIVRERVLATGYPERRVHFVKGPVEQTVPGHAPARIALLRLDTDWYESTLHELNHMYPCLADGGVLIVDDYGHFDGARRAVDEYFAPRPVLLNRIDYTGRLAIKA